MSDGTTMVGRIPARMNRTSPYRTLPKVELHCRLEGSVRPETFLDLARSNAVTVDAAHPGEVYRHEVGQDRMSLLGRACSVLRTVDDFRRVAYEATVDAAVAGVRYRELLVSPALHLRRGVDLDTLWRGVSAGLDDAHHDSGLLTRMVVGVDGAGGPEPARALVETVLERAGDHRPVGVAGDPGPGDGWAAVVGQAHGHGLRVSTPCTPARHRWLPALIEAGVDRIGHGVGLLDHPTLARSVAARRLPVSACPSSDVDQGLVGGLAGHPFAALRDIGVLVTLNSDVPALLSFDLGDEYLRVADSFGLSLADLVAISLDGIEASWMDESDKASMAASVADEAGAAGLG